MRTNFFHRYCFTLFSATLLTAWCALAEPSTEDDLRTEPLETKTTRETFLPAVHLTPKLLYQITTAEIAAQRHETGVAFATFLSLAEDTRDPRLARRATELALYDNAQPEALEAAQLWLQLSPNSIPAAQIVLSTQLATGRLSEAERSLTHRFQNTQSLLQRLPLYQHLPRFLSQAPDKNRALQLAERLLAPYDQEAEAQLSLAQVAFFAGASEQALHACDAALALSPNFESAALLKTELLLQKKLIDSALAFVNAFLEHHPAALELRTLYARVLLEKGQRTLARQQFEVLLSADTNNAQGQFSLGSLAFNEKNLPLAETWFQRYLASAETTQDGRETGQALIYLSHIAQRQGNNAKARQLLEQIHTNALRINVAVRRAEILAQEKKLHQARQLLQQTPANNEREQIQLILADTQLLSQTKAYPEVFAVLSKAIKKYPRSSDLLYEHGLAAEKLGLIDTMENSLRLVIQLSPDNAYGYNALGYSFADHNLRLEEAQNLIKKALSLAPNDGAIMDSMGWVLYRLGDLEAAENHLQHAKELTEDSDVLVHLGEVLWTQKRFDEAREQWREVQRKAPKNELLRQTLTRFKVVL